MTGQSFTFILLFIVISSIYGEPDPAKVLNAICQAQLKAIKAGTFDNLMKERQDCREKAVPKDVLAKVNKCEELLPMTTPDQVTKVCADMKSNYAKLTELMKCAEKALGRKYKSKFAECRKKMDPDSNEKSPID